MRKRKLKLNKDTLLVLESGALAEIAAGIAIPKTGGSSGCTATGCTCECPTMHACPPPPTQNCTLGCPTYPQPI